MELTLAIVTVLGIFIGIPAVIGFAIAGIYMLSDRRARRAQRVEALGRAAIEARPKATAAKRVTKPAGAE